MFSNSNIRFLPKILVGFYLLLFVVLSYSIFQISHSFQESIHQYDNITSVSTKKLTFLGEIRKEGTNIQVAVLTHILMDSKIKMDVEDSNVLRVQIKVDKLLSDYQSLIDTKEERKLFARVIIARNNNASIREELLKLSRTNDPETIDLLEDKQKDIYEQNQDALADLSEYLVSQTSAKDKAADAYAENAKITIIILLVIVAIVLLLLGYSVFKIIREHRLQNDSLKEHQEKIIETNDALVKSNTELKKINSELDRFVYSASHELRSPLTSIMGLISMAEDEDSTQVMNCFHKIRQSVARLDGTIRNIIVHSKNARTDIKLSEINLKGIIHSTIEKLKDEAKVEIVFSEGIEHENLFLGDAERIHTILVNLLSNAIKYVDVSKEKHWIKVSASTTSSSLELQVEDNGIGIENQYSQKIFDMFFKASNISTGSGLGLYITKEMVEKLGGKIQVRSIVGEGSCFTVSIPKNNQVLSIAA